MADVPRPSSGNRRLPTELPAQLSPGTILRAPQASSYLNLSQSTLAKARIYGTGPKWIRLSPRAVGYRLCDLDAWVASRVRNSTSEAA